jgi:hypothetical protein
MLHPTYDLRVGGKEHIWETMGPVIELVEEDKVFRRGRVATVQRDEKRGSIAIVVIQKVGLQNAEFCGKV